MKNNIAFAYFANNIFIGWYADSFGSIGKTPKLYGNTERQVDTIIKNFRHKLKAIKKSTFEVELDRAKSVGQCLATAIYDSEQMLRDADVELRIVQTPFYDGPDPRFSKKIDKKFRKYEIKLYHAWCKEKRLDPGIPPKTFLGIGLVDNYKVFNKIYPSRGSKNWIYMEYAQVKVWAVKEPTEFLRIIKNKD